MPRQPPGRPLNTEPAHESRSDGRAGRLAFWLIALSGLAAARIPYLTSPLYILDNDEAVLGMMARQMAAGMEWPMFFPRQNYGLAVFETLPAAVAFELFGDTATVLTATVLSLFLGGVVLHAVAFGRLSGSRRWGRALAILLALVPGWIVWSTKARGLYVSGFVLTGMLLVLLVRDEPRRPHVILGSLITGCLALVQPLWLVVSLPFWADVALAAGRGDPAVRRREVLIAGAVAFAIWLVPTVVIAGREAVWQPDFVGPGAGGFVQIRTFLAQASRDG